MELHDLAVPLRFNNRARKRKALTLEERQKILELANTNMSMKKIAETLNISYSRVWSSLNYGIER